MSRRLNRPLALLAALVMMLSVLVVTNPQQAKATGNDWFATALPNFSQSNIFASPSGDVVQVGCSGNHTTGSETSGPFVYGYDSSDGAPTSNVSGVFREYVISCEQGTMSPGGATIDSGGTVYATHVNYDNSYTTTVVAYKDGVPQWPSALQPTTLPGCSGRVDVGQLHVGADGDLYFIGTPASYTCSHKAYLFGVEADTGAVKFQKSLGVYGSYWIGAHENGLVVKYSNSSEKFLYFDYNGVEDTQRSFQATDDSWQRAAHM